MTFDMSSRSKMQAGCDAALSMEVWLALESGVCAASRVKGVATDAVLL